MNVLATRMLGNWQTSIVGIGVLIATLGRWLSGDGSLSMEDLTTLLIGAGFIGAKDAGTGSAPSSG